MNMTTAPPAVTRQDTPWHALPEEAVLDHLNTTIQGLSTEEAHHRLENYGYNVLPASKPPTLIQIILHQIASPLIYILIAAGTVAVLLQDYKDAAFIFGVIVLNAGIGAAQEWRAEKSAHSLQKLVRTQARLRRDGHFAIVPAEELVPGDIVQLETGDRVPADLRLLEVHSLAIDESFLTGESIAAQKRCDLLPEATIVSERANLAFASAIVTHGRALGVVIATGSATEVGRIAHAITSEVAGKAPLVLRMEKFARQIGIIILLIAVVLGLILLAQGVEIGDVFLIVVAMAVSAIPEGLPVALTVVLSIATQRMSRRNVIVRHLNTVESLGSCTLIASDKTGTLTVNQQTVRQIVTPDGARYTVTGEGYQPNGEIKAASHADQPLTMEELEHLRQIAIVGVMCNAAEIREEAGTWEHQGDAMDVALLFFSHKLGFPPQQVLNNHERLAEIPFSSDKRFAAVAFETVAPDFPSAYGTWIAVKGALESVIPFCDTMQIRGNRVPLDAGRITELADQMANAGYRVLALAHGPRPPAPQAEVLAEAELHGLTLLGLAGFIDPLRPEVRPAVREAQDAGVRVVMITGDHPATAFHIARELEIAQSPDQVMTGAALAGLSDSTPAELAEALREVRVFARVSPDQKLQIVDALMALGEFVAVTGDGVNDAPALRRANIGVAMGSGADVAKDTASLIITDDNFASIVAGIEEGRFAYANVRKVILLLIATGAAELLLLGLSILFLLPLPLLAVQILWLNLVTNGIQDVALAFEAGEGEVMRDRPRAPTEGVFNRLMLQQVVIAGLTMGLVCFAFWWMLMASGWNEDSARNVLLTLLILMQSWHVFNSRSEVRSAFRVPLRNNPILIIGALVALGIHVMATLLPVGQDLLRLEPLPLTSWLILAAVSSIVLIVMEVFKWLNRHGVHVTHHHHD